MWALIQVGAVFFKVNVILWGLRPQLPDDICYLLFGDITSNTWGK